MVAETEFNVTQVFNVRNSQLSLRDSVIDSETNTVTIILSCRRYSELGSWLSIGKILFICLAIVYLLNTFNEKISQLITEPIEKILDDVKNGSKYESA